MENSNTIKTTPSIFWTFQTLTNVNAPIHFPMVNICVTNFEFSSRDSSLTHLNIYKLSDEKWALSQAVVSDEFLDLCQDISRISLKLLRAFVSEVLCICRCRYMYLSKKWHVFVCHLFHSLMWESNENDVREGSTAVWTLSEFIWFGIW